VRAFQIGGGVIPSPFECWLTLRGIRTLPWRMRAHSANASRVAQFLAGHRNVVAVHYPGLESDPGHALATRQMALGGGMLSVEVRGGRAGAMGLTGRLRVFTRATSLGGTESLIEHRASVEGRETRAPEGLLRVSVGLENAEDLVEDLEHALDY
jgi:cystathionine gamma-synthase